MGACVLFCGAAAVLSLAACSAGDGAAPESVEDIGSSSQELVTTYEAENALISGAKVLHDSAGYTGSGYVDYQNASNDFIEWTVNAPAGGVYGLTFRYALISGSRPLKVSVNGAVANASLAFPATGSWTTWKTVSMNAHLTVGTNKVRATAITSSGGNIDNLQVSNNGPAILAVKKTPGCGVAPNQATGQFVKYTISTSGTKAADCAARNLQGQPVCGPWSVPRDYYVWLPVGYDPNKAYPLVFEGPGCGGNGTSVYPFTNAAGVASVGNTVIRVGLTPPPNSVGHGTNPGQGCFDDKEGDDSVDFVFYERLRDTLKNQYCYDDNRVFAAGNSSGSWLANELACKYSGSGPYALRGVVANTGGLPTDPAYKPTCTTNMTSGMWIHEVGDTTNPFAGAKVAINRAMVSNGCSTTNYDTAQFDDYPIGGGNSPSTCKLIRGCPVAYPLVVCALPGNAHGSHDNVVNPGGSVFLSGFSSPPFTN
jgi:poly(3-hydroxybutyrate) depolymerase